MKWFSNDWREQMTLEQCAHVEAEYEAHTTALREAGDSRVTPLLDVYLHDGEVQSVRLEGDRLEWRILIGDLQAGYEFVTITYGDADVLVGPDGKTLQWLTDPEVELLHDEVEPLADGSVMHRILLWPEGELWIRFRTVQVVRVPASPSDHRSAAPSSRRRPFRRLLRMRRVRR